MSPNGRNLCNQAVALIREGQYRAAQTNLRLALQCTHNQRAWSKLMLAIRELNRVIN